MTHFESSWRYSEGVVSPFTLHLSFSTFSMIMDGVVSMMLGFVIICGFLLHALWLIFCQCCGCLQRGLVEFMCSVFVASWTGVVKYHGPRPSRRAKQVPFSPSSGFCHWFCLQFSKGKVFKQHCQGLMFC
jgi:hypothetical protein